MMRFVCSTILLTALAVAAEPAREISTPFGTVKVPVSQLQREPELDPYLKVYDEGDQVRFERPSPFGVARWRKAKTALDANERRAWEAARSLSAANPTGQK